MEIPPYKNGYFCILLISPPSGIHASMIRTAGYDWNRIRSAPRHSLIHASMIRTAGYGWNRIRSAQVFAFTAKTVRIYKFSQKNLPLAEGDLKWADSVTGKLKAELLRTGEKNCKKMLTGRKNHDIIKFHRAVKGKTAKVGRKNKKRWKKSLTNRWGCARV